MKKRVLTLKEAGRVRRRLRDVQRLYPSQAALAKDLGVSQSAVSSVLSSVQFASFSFAMKAAKLLGFKSAEELLNTSYFSNDPAPPSVPRCHHYWADLKFRSRD